MRRLGEWLLKRHTLNVRFARPFGHALVLAINDINLGLLCLLVDALGFWLLEISALVAPLLLINPLLNELSEPVDGNVSHFTAKDCLVGYQPREHVFISVESALLVRHIVTLAALLV